MSSFSLCSDEDIEAIFCHLDFVKKCQFRRCSRRWNRLLRLPAILRTVVFHLTYNRDLRTPRSALRKAAPHIVNLVVIFAKGVSVDKWLDKYWSKLFRNKGSPFDAIEKFPSKHGHHERRLVLCNFDPIYEELLYDTYKNPAFDWIELRHAKVIGDDVPVILHDALYEKYKGHEDDTEYAAVLAFLRKLEDSSGDVGWTIRVTESYNLKQPTVVTQLDASGTTVTTKPKSLVTVLFDLVKDNTKHINPQETSLMLQRLSQYSARRVQSIFVSLLKMYDPDFVLQPPPSVWTFNFDLCSPLVGRILAFYEDKVVDKDDGDWTDDDE